MSFILGLRYNRPARRYLARLYCLLRSGWASAHAEEWWPDLALTLPSAGDGAIRYRGKVIAPLLAHPGLPDGMDEIVVVGSGPSLARQAKERIPIESALLLNGAINLIGHGAARPLGVVIEDERFVWRHWRAIAATVPPRTHCYFSTSAIRALCETRRSGWRRKRCITSTSCIGPMERGGRMPPSCGALRSCAGPKTGKRRYRFSPGRA